MSTATSMNLRAATLAAAQLVVPTALTDGNHSHTDTAHGPPGGTARQAGMMSRFKLDNRP